MEIVKFPDEERDGADPVELTLGPGGEVSGTVTDDAGTPLPGVRVEYATERVRLFVPQPFSNHNGGGLAFGNDGHLYITLGDGGSGGDPLDLSQNLASAFGKIFRIDPLGSNSANAGSTCSSVTPCLPGNWTTPMQTPPATRTTHGKRPRRTSRARWTTCSTG